MIALASCVLATSATLMLAPGAITRWSSPEPVVGEITQVSKQGLGVRREGEDLPEPIPWFDVREIDPPSVEAERFLEVADTAWRAHARMERGDGPGALDLYTRLAPGYLWERGAQSAEVSLGMARCLIGQGRRVEAVGPMLSWFVGAGVHAPGQPTGEASIDAQHGLLIGLPPVFSPADRLLTIGALPDSAPVTDRERLLHDCFALALAVRGDPANRVLIDGIDARRREPGARDAGAELVADMVMARVHPDPEQRAAARGALQRRARTDRGGWVEAWARLGLGAAMISDDDPQSNERGLIELLHVIVRLRQVSPALTELGAELAGEYLVRTHRPCWAAQIMLDARGAGAGTPSTTREHQADD